ncbi:MAG: 6-carboxytetrahydropterin synthase QueD [Candidatus Tantalella remota]|nr:6-carboxytetrahydropterin synthase QueD [Candidatus Tantalella remota]
MYTVKVRANFSSAHNLRDYKGKCEDLHGHNWKVEVAVSSESLNKTGMVVDFKDLKKFLNEVMEELDHTNLNDLAPFSTINPTSENIAKYVYDEISAKDKELRVQYVTVWETDTSEATYSV